MDAPNDDGLSLQRMSEPFMLATLFYATGEITLGRTGQGGSIPKGMKVTGMVDDAGLLTVLEVIKYENLLCFGCRPTP
jgi:hypothetical protein